MLQTPLSGKKIQADGVFIGPSPGCQLNQDGCWGARPRVGGEWHLPPASLRHLRSCLTREELGLSKRL